MATLTMTQFLQFLKMHCAERQREGAHLLSEERGANEAYQYLGRMIATFQQEYAEEKALTRKAEQAQLDAIETDERRRFDDPVNLLLHVQQIANKQPFFDSAEISLAAIRAFCNDFLSIHRAEIKAELRQSAPF